MCLWLRTTSVHNTTQNSSDNLPSYLQTSIIAQMLSIGGDGVILLKGQLSYHRVKIKKQNLISRKDYIFCRSLKTILKLVSDLRAVRVQRWWCPVESRPRSSVPWSTSELPDRVPTASTPSCYHRSETPETSVQTTYIYLFIYFLCLSLHDLCCLTFTVPVPLQFVLT